jgi:dTDP-4-amino-4,6-dideoxygalactose transaminase
MNDFTAEPADHKDAMVAAAKRVIESGWYILGRELEAFEKSWAAASGAAYAVGVGNGMDAIEIALRVQGIGPGDEVITTPMTAFASVLAIIRCGATPVLADISAESALLDPESVRRCLSKKTRAVMPVHLYGELRDLDKWVELCADAGVILLEDCAQSHLAIWKGKPAGSFGPIGAFSFYPTKNLGALGDGGALVTSEKRLAEKAARFRNYGQSERYHHPDLGMNSRLDEMQAAILSERLKWLPALTERRRAVVQRLRSGIANKLVRTPPVPQEAGAHVYHLFVVNCERRDELRTHLAGHDIQALIHYPVPIHRQESCRELKRDPRGLANSEAHARTCLSLPCHPQLTDGDVARIVAAVNSFG